jgi:hypothetical protein
MELDVNGAIVANPTAADIARALDASSFPKNWYIAIASGNASLDAQAQEDGSFRLSYGDDKRRPSETVDAATVKETYLAFLAGGEHAPAGAPRMKFVPDTRPLQGRSGDQPPFPAMVVMVAIITLVGFFFAMESWVPGSIRHHVPGGDSDYFWVGLIFLPLVALMVVIVATKIIELRRAKSWVETTGRIVRSQIEVRRHRFEGEAETVKNVPDVEYEFQVGARTVHGLRIGIGDDALADPEATLKRYPVGANVTVYYDPRDPTKCVLERGGPGLSKRETMTGCLAGLVFLAVIGGALYWVITHGPDFIRAHFPKATVDPRFSIFAICFGLVALLMFLGVWRYSKQATRWPSVKGKIVRSEVEGFEERDRDGSLQRSYRAAVEFSYAVHGQDYHSNQVKLALDLSGSKGFADGVVAKYPVGSTVDVHYEPSNPSNAVLEISTSAPWLIAVIALACFALAAWQLGVFR